MARNWKKPMNIPDPPRSTRRNLLFSATGIVAAAGIAAAAWPLIAQLLPSSEVRASDEVLEIDVGALRPGERIVKRWKNVPVFAARRTDAMLTAMQQPSFVAGLVDAESSSRQQPPCARNWHLSVDPRVSVLAGVCTRCSCVPEYFAEESAIGMAGGYVCPCCASHYDQAGRACGGVAPFNLPVPPYRYASAATVIVGRNPAGEIFSFDSVERL